MKAYQIMMFLMLFNVSVSLISIVPIENPDGTYRYGIFQPGVSPGLKDGVDVYNVSNVGAGELGSSDAVVWRFLGTTITALVLGMIAGAVVAYLTKVPADSAVAYSIISTEFWACSYSSLAIFWDMGKIPTGSVGGVEMNIGIMAFVYIFTAILAIIYVAWLVQLVRGGFKSMA